MKIYKIILHFPQRRETLYSGCVISNVCHYIPACVENVGEHYPTSGAVNNCALGRQTPYIPLRRIPTNLTDSNKTNGSNITLHNGISNVASFIFEYYTS